MEPRNVFAMGAAAGALLCLTAALASAQGGCDAVKVKANTDSLRAEANRPRSLAPRRTLVRRYASNIDSTCTPPTPVDTSSTPPPASAPFLTFSVTDTVLRVRPATPYYVFAVSRVDSAGQQLSDSARITIAPALSKLWWNGPARRWELYDATTAGTMVVTATYGSLAASQAVRVSLDSVPVPPPPPPPDTTTPPPPDTSAPPPIVGAFAQLPRVVPRVPVIPRQCTVTVTNPAALQSAIHAARAGEQICLQPGIDFPSITLPARGDAGLVVVRTAAPDSLFALPGQRVRPSKSIHLARIIAPGGNVRAITVQPRAVGWLLVGLEVTQAATTSLTSMVDLGVLSAASLTDIPDHIWLDRSYVHGTATLTLRRCVSLGTRTGGVVNSWLEDCHEKGADSQAILAMAAGPHLIENNYLQGAGENLMYGGLSPTVAGLNPCDVTIRRNHITKPASWKGVWSIKNVLELKSGCRFDVDANVIEGSWTDGQVGFAVNMKSSGGTGSGCFTSQVTLRRNWIRHAGAGITLGALDGGCTVPSRNYEVTGNVVDTLNVSPYTGVARLMQIIGRVDSVRVVGNLFAGAVSQTQLLLPDGSGALGFVYANNVGARGSSGVKGSGRGEGTASLAGYSAGYVWSGNTLIGASVTGYPLGTIWALNESAVPAAAAIRAAVRQATTGVVIPP